MIQIRNDPRLAGEVIRYHTWPHIRSQSVGEHSWQVCRIILSIAPKYAEQLLPHAIMHDVGEIATGDVPYPVKANNKELGALFDDLEHKAIDEICSEWNLPAPIKHWDKTLRWVFKLAEFIEMWEWGFEEEMRGNRLAELVTHRCREVIGRMLDQYEDEEVQGLTERYIQKRNETWLG